MSNPANTTNLPPIEIIRSSETQDQVDVSSIETLMEIKGQGDAKYLARFTVQHSLRRTLPYGMWTCFDGRQVLFNREYQPILEKKDGNRGYCHGNEWVDHATIKSTQYFYDDVTAPMRYLLKHLGGDTITAKEAKACKKALLISLQFLKEFTPEESNSVSPRYSLLSR